MATICAHCGQKLPNQLLASDTEFIIDGYTVYDRKGKRTSSGMACFCPICSRELEKWLSDGNRVSRIS